MKHGRGEIFAEIFCACQINTEHRRSSISTYSRTVGCAENVRLGMRCYLGINAQHVVVAYARSVTFVKKDELYHVRGCKTLQMTMRHSYKLTCFKYHFYIDTTSVNFLAHLV